jgi:hypothetical protein
VLIRAVAVGIVCTVVAVFSPRAAGLEPTPAHDATAPAYSTVSPHPVPPPEPEPKKLAKPKRKPMSVLRQNFKRRLIQGAKKFLGVREQGSNYGKSVERFLRHAGLGGGYPWCAAFAWYVVDAHGLYRGPRPSNLAYVPALVDWARKHDLVVDRYRVQPGMLVTVRGYGHVTLCVRRKGHQIQTIGGNEGDAVRLQWRSISSIDLAVDVAKTLKRKEQE